MKIIDANISSKKEKRTWSILMVIGMEYGDRSKIPGAPEDSRILATDLAHGLK